MERSLIPTLDHNMPKANPILINDFHGGVYRESAVSTFLAPPFTVAQSLNVNYDTGIGLAAVRPGTVPIGGTIVANQTPLGFSEFVGATTTYLVAVYSGASNASIYYYDTSWNTSTVTNLNNTVKNRFAVLGNSLFRVSTGNAMTSTLNGNVWSTDNCITTDSVVPSLVIRAKQRMLASGYSGFKSRIYFSSIIDPNNSPFISWSTDPSSGNWIDINPDDGDYITAFAQTSATTLVFKQNAMYRLDVISKTTDTDNIFNIGTPSQEAVVTCQGVVYFFSGLDIRATTGDFPQQISRLGVQDYINAIPQSNWDEVCAGTDGLNVYFSIGDITLFTSRNNQTTYQNVVLKFSPRDQSWSIHSYAQDFRYFAQYTTTAGRTFIGLDTSGNSQTLNSGTTDKGTPIYYELITQDVDCGNRSHTKTISDKVVVYAQDGLNGEMQIIPFNPNEGSPVNLKIQLKDRVNVCSDINVQFNFCQFRWFGNTSTALPILEGIYVENVDDKGITL